MATQEKTWNVANRLHSLKDSDNPEVNHIIAGADEIYDDAKGDKQSDINAQTDAALADRYTKAETYSKEQLDSLITKPDVNYVTVVATDATTSVTDVLPATGEANTIYRAGNWNGSQYDPTMYALLAWDGTTYVCLAVRSFVGEVYDISVNHPDGQGNPTPYADLTAALGINGANIPADIRRGGMRIQFIKGNAQSSDNKYVQYRLMSQNFSVTESDWQGVDNEPTAGSKNLVKSGGVYGSASTNYNTFGYDVFKKSLVDERLVTVLGEEESVSASSVVNGYYDIDTRQYVSNANYTLNIFEVEEGEVYKYNCVLQGNTAASIILLYDDKVLAVIRDGELLQGILKVEGFNKIGLQTSYAYLKHYPSFIENKMPSDIFNTTDGNLHDSNTDVVGKLTTSGYVNDDDRFKTTGYIRVYEGVTYICSIIVNGFVQPCIPQTINFYDKGYNSLGNYTFIETDKSIFIPVTNAVYARVSVLSAEAAILQIVASKFVENPLLYHKYLATLPSEISGSILKNDSVGIEKISFKNTVRGKNLFNKDSNGILDGYYLNSLNGISQNASYFISDFIEINSSKSYVFSDNGSAFSLKFLNIYDENKLKIAFYENVASLSPTVGAKFIKFSSNITKKNTIQIEEGTTVSSYSAYTETITIKEQYIPQLPVVIPDNSISLRKIAKSNPISTILGVDREWLEGSIASNATLSIDNSPVYIKRFGKMSFRADITTFGEFIIGKGYQSRSGRYIKIDVTNITPIFCDLSGNETLGTPVPHGLTISDFVFVVMWVEDITCSVYIMSKGGSFKIASIGGNWANAAETPFVHSNGLVASASKLSVAYSELLKKIWIVGDSYLSLGDPARWPYHVEDLGFKKFLVNALSGGASQVYEDALKCLSIGSPKYLLWCLGMNYASDTDVNTPNSTWQSEVETIMELCEARGLELILCTIPNTATKNHTGKNKYVKDSGLRYVDMAKAVGAETFVSGTNTWYDGYCSDGTHPTEIGAKALASQCLSDFPEIMEY